MSKDRGTDAEAAVFCRYLVGDLPSEHIKQLYAAVLARESSTLSKADARLLQYAVQHPGRIVYLDGALALVWPKAALRQRLYAMFAITEATPEYAAKYLPAKHGPWYVVVVGLLGVRAVLRTIVGLVLLRLIGTKA